MSRRARGGTEAAAPLNLNAPVIAAQRLVQYLQSINRSGLLLSQHHPGPLWSSDPCGAGAVVDAKRRGLVGLEAARRRRLASDKTTPPLGTIALHTQPVSPRPHGKRGEAGDDHLGREAGRTDSQSLGAGDGLEGLAEQPTVTPKPPSRILRDTRDTLPSRACGRPRPTCGEPADSSPARAGAGTTVVNGTRDWRERSPSVIL
jgi:hypothetical protein